MNAVKKAVGMCLAVLALAAVGAAPAGAEIIRPGDSGQPLASGNLESHGVLHCQPAAELFTGNTSVHAPGVLVFKPNGEIVLGGRPGGVCEEVYQVFTGELG